MGIVSNFKDFKALKNLYNLALVNLDISQDLFREYDDYDRDLEYMTGEAEKILFSIQNKQDRLKKANKYVIEKQNEIKEIKQKMGISKYLVYVRPRYWKIRKELHQLKKTRKEIAKLIEKDYIKLKANRYGIKTKKKEMTDFEQYVNDLAKKHEKEIEIVKYYEANKNKLKTRMKQSDYNTILQCVEFIKLNNGGILFYKGKKITLSKDQLEGIYKIFKDIIKTTRKNRVNNLKTRVIKIKNKIKNIIKNTRKNTRNNVSPGGPQTGGPGNNVSLGGPQTGGPRNNVSLGGPQTGGPRNNVSPGGLPSGSPRPKFPSGR